MMNFKAADSGSSVDYEIPLHAAIWEGRLDIVEKTLKASPESVMEVNSIGRMCLHIAVGYNNWKAVKYLLEWLGKNISFAHVINTTDFNGNNVLHFAFATLRYKEKPRNNSLHCEDFCKDNLKIIKKLVQRDKNLCLQRNKSGDTPFHLAVVRGRVDTLKTLLEACPEAVKDVGYFDRTCLHIAVLREKGEALEYLINWLGESSSFSNIINNTPCNEQTVSQETASEGSSLVRNVKSVDSAEIEDSCSSKTEAENPHHHEAVWSKLYLTTETTPVQRYKNFCLIKDKNGRTPLHVAAAIGRLDIIETLLKACPESVKEVDLTWLTCLHIAVKCNKSEAVEYLLDWFGETSGFSNVINSVDHNGYTALHIAVDLVLPLGNSLNNEELWEGNLKIVEKLAQSDKKLCLQKEKYGCTPLHLAVMRGRVDTIKTLLEACPDAVTNVNSWGNTCLHAAILHKKHEALEYLVNWLRESYSFPKIINNSSFNERTVSQQATSAGSFSTLVNSQHDEDFGNKRKLVQPDKNIYLQKNNFGLTALHYAAVSGTVDTLQMLIEACPESLKEVSFTNKTCLHMAVLHKNNKAIEYLTKLFDENSRMIGSKTSNCQMDSQHGTTAGSYLPKVPHGGKEKRKWKKSKVLICVMPCFMSVWFEETHEED